MTKLLLDTHAFLWWLAGDESLGEKTIALIGNSENQVYISAATAWEISIKRQLGKLKAPEDTEANIVKSGFVPLQISFFHAQQAGSLPGHHRDPFDRMLIAQAQSEGFYLVTADNLFSLYGVRLIDAKQ